MSQACKTPSMSRKLQILHLKYHNTICWSTTTYSLWCHFRTLPVTQNDLWYKKKISSIFQNKSSQSYQDNSRFQQKPSRLNESKWFPYVLFHAFILSKCFLKLIMLSSALSIPSPVKALVCWTVQSLLEISFRAKYSITSFSDNAPKMKKIYRIWKEFQYIYIIWINIIILRNGTQ